MSIHSLRKKFVKDEAIPIQVMKSPYFEYFLNLYQNVYQSKERYDRFVKEVGKYGGEEAFTKYYYQVTTEAIDQIKDSNAFKKFNEDKLKAFDIQINVSKDDIYRPENDGRVFISIDLKKANFHSLKYYDKEILNGKRTYEEWIQQFTDSTYMINSKNIRQIIFGNLNPKKQQKIQHFIMSKYLEHILKYVDKSVVKNATHDEIVLLDAEKSMYQTINDEIQALSIELGMPTRVEMFRLVKQSEPKVLGYVKEYILDENKKIEFKKVQQIYMPQAYKLYFNQSIEENDLVFYHEGQMAKFLCPVLEELKEKTFEER